ncbi:hypothetical protein [Dyella sp. GSA-30]|uniref:hypothetical protein n=1 Tax=Dyella sp. GSA-30 TaxID=2994496 RepID=UPI002491BBCD|nr:hypothetical protein [Dyella sp. GSA-30]BDU20933.1 hypothetical protein DYGSA30_23900 [Dyella sp. GSA-30]
MSWHQLNVGAHIAMGVLGLLAGLIPLCSSKGSTIHRRAGRVFVYLAGVVLATAVIADVFFPVPMTLVAVTLSASYQYVSSLRALHLRTSPPGLLDAALAGATLLACGFFIMSMGKGNASFTPAIGYSTIGYVAIVAIYDLSRGFWGELWLRRVRPLDHGLKMTGVYFAMLSAGAGNLLRGLQPWSQILPSVVGTLVLIALAVRYIRRWHAVTANAMPIVE